MPKEAVHSVFSHAFDDDMTNSVFLYFTELQILFLAKDGNLSIKGETAVILDRTKFLEFAHAVEQIKTQVLADKWMEHERTKDE